jgi:hypothetical protein
MHENTFLRALIFKIFPDHSMTQDSLRNSRLRLSISPPHSNFRLPDLHVDVHIPVVEARDPESNPIIVN